MANFLRLLVGILLFPLCWGLTLALTDAVISAAGGNLCSAETFSLLGGIIAFVICWIVLPKMVKTYVFGHEMTHAIWGLLFGAKPTKLRVSASGGSVNLTKTNLLITLAPYFFPFYTFVVVILALIVYIFVRPLPYLPIWMFLIGFTWTFHILFTIETLSQRQPDVTTYGRVFSWVFIYLINIFIVLIWVTLMTQVTFKESFSSLLTHTTNAYYISAVSIYKLLRYIVSFAINLFSSK